MRSTSGKSEWQDKILVWPEQDRDWARAYAQAMLLAGAAESGVAAALSDSLAAVQASGERPGELLARLAPTAGPVGVGSFPQLIDLSGT